MDQQEKQINQLEQRLSESLRAEDFFNLGSGKLITELLTSDITRLTNAVISDKYLKDHPGYVNAVAELRAAKRLLDRLHALSNPQTKRTLRAKLEELKDGVE